MNRFAKMERQISVRQVQPIKGEIVSRGKHTSRGGTEYSGRTEPKRTYSFDFWQKFPEFLG